MANNVDDFQKMSQTGIDSALKMWGDWGKSWQAIAAEMSDYSKRSLEDGTDTFHKLLSARSVEQVVEIQSSYAKRSYETYVREVSKIGTMYAELAKSAARPVEKLVQPGR